MERAIFCLPLAFLFLASALPTNAQSSAPPAEASPGTPEGPAPELAMPVHYYDVRYNFTLNCSDLAADGAELVWKKNNTRVEEIPMLKGRYLLVNSTFSIPNRAQEEDFGNYSCSAGVAVREWDVRGRPQAKLPPNTNIVEDQLLKIQCKLTGKPYSDVTWSYSNTSAAMENGTTTEVVEEGWRVRLLPSAQGVPHGVLQLNTTQRSDAGWYRCTPTEGGAAGAITTLRVKDRYAALWPFLGICAEVFVLCAIILVYEKRRTKPELDDSDTDNHDQKKS